MTIDYIINELNKAGGNFPGIYKITHKADGRVYIGQTSQKIADRMKQHLTNTNSNKESENIDRAIQKEGIDAFTYEVLFRLSHLGDDPQELLWELEFQCINQYDSYAKGYNLTKGNHVKKFQNTVYYIMHTIKMDAFRDFIVEPYELNLYKKKVLLINSFGPKVKTILDYNRCEVREIYTSEYITYNETKKKYEVDKHLYGEYIMNELKTLKNEYFDLIIANPPYGKIGADITDFIRKYISYTDYINLLPANDYKRNKTRDLFNYQSDMKVISNGFEDATVTTHVCRIHKNRVNDMTLVEFERSNYTDESLDKYFIELNKRKHYAIDTANCPYWHNGPENISNKTTFILGERDISSKRFPTNKDQLIYKWNIDKTATPADLHIATNDQLSQIICTFKTEEECLNFNNFVYGNVKFINKIFKALNADKMKVLYKAFPKVDWTRPWTVEEILTDYGYTEDEIKEVIADLDNYKYLKD